VVVVVGELVASQRAGAPGDGEQRGEDLLGPWRAGSCGPRKIFRR
jgi:hypothetical protein